MSDMNSQLHVSTSTVVSDTSLVEETLLVELHLGANVSETWQHFISLTFSSSNKAFERWPVRSLINFSSTPEFNKDAHITQRLWLLFGVKPAYQTLPLPLFEYSISPFIFVLSGLGYRFLNQINLFFGCFCLPKTWQHHISWPWPNRDQGMYMCSALNNDGPQGLVTLLKYLTTKANNYWKTMAKNIPFTMPKSVRIFSLFLVNNARLRSNLRNSCFVFHRGFQTLENNKSTRPTAFHQFSRVWKPRWNAWLTLDRPLINAWLILDQPLINAYWPLINPW